MDNYNIIRAESLIDQGISNLPVGTAYYILKAKMLEVQKLYYQQAQKEYAETQVETAQDQNDAENDLAPAS